MVSKEKCRWEKIHIKKLDKLHSERRYISKPKYRIVKKIINNVFSYTLTSEEDCALSFSLDQHVPTKNNTNVWKFVLIHTETYKESWSKTAGWTKTKIRRTCENYSKLKE